MARGRNSRARRLTWLSAETSGHALIGGVVFYAVWILSEGGLALSVLTDTERIGSLVRCHGVALSEG
jgi:hypothetical protein